MRALKRLQPLVNQINELEPEFKQKTDDELKAMTPLFRERIAQGETLDDLLPEAFAAVREASQRTLGMRPFDVQLIGGIALHQGKIAEMATGEGKTLVATMPAYLNALSGKGVHIITVNDYLARRDCEWMGQIHTFHGTDRQRDSSRHHHRKNASVHTRQTSPTAPTPNSALIFCATIWPACRYAGPAWLQFCNH